MNTTNPWNFYNSRGEGDVLKDFQIWIITLNLHFPISFIIYHVVNSSILLYMLTMGEVP